MVQSSVARTELPPCAGWRHRAKPDQTCCTLRGPSLHVTHAPMTGAGPLSKANCWAPAACQVAAAPNCLHTAVARSAGRRRAACTAAWFLALRWWSVRTASALRKNFKNHSCQRRPGMRWKAFEAHIFMCAAGQAGSGGPAAALPEITGFKNHAPQCKAWERQKVRTARKTKNTLERLELSDFFTSGSSLVLVLLKGFWSWRKRPAPKEEKTQSIKGSLGSLCITPISDKFALVTC